MAGPDEPTKPAAQPQGDDPAPPRKRRRRRARGRGTAKRTSGTVADPTGRASSASEGSGSTRKRRASTKKKRATAAQKKPARAKQRGGNRGGGKRGAGKRSSGTRAAKIPTTREISAGAVLYRRADGDIEVVLASRRTRRGQLAWGLAKGGIELGESRRAAAIREVREETGLTGVIEEDLGDTRYMYVWDDIRIRKTVHFFLMRWTGGDVDDRDDEMEEIRWFPLDRAIKRAAYRGERDMLIKASEILR